MFIIALFLFFSGIGTIMFQSKVTPGNSIDWIAGVVLIGLAIAFFISGVFSEKRIHQDGHHTLP